MLSEDEIVRLSKDTAPLTEPSVGAVKAIVHRPFDQGAGQTGGVYRCGRRFDQADQDRRGTDLQSRLRADQLDANGKPYFYVVFAYRVRAVNAQGLEGGPSPYVLTIPSWLRSGCSRRKRETSAI